MTCISAHIAPLEGLTAVTRLLLFPSFASPGFPLAAEADLCVCSAGQQKMLSLSHHNLLRWKWGVQSRACCISATAVCDLLLPSDRWEIAWSNIERSPVYFGTADYCQTWRETIISIVENVVLVNEQFPPPRLCVLLVSKEGFLSFCSTGLN